ncbi:MAG: RNA polymerase sigma factor [Streptosporangiaceae bacterium]
MMKGDDDYYAEFEALFKTLAPGLRVYLQMRMRYNRSLAEDALQEAARIMWVKWTDVRDHPNQKAWLYMVAGRLADRMMKKASREVPEEDMSVRADAGQNDSEGSSTPLQEAVGKLPERQRQAIWLHYFYGFKQHEVAAIMHIQRGAVAALLFQARRRLADLLGYQAGEGQI